MTSSWFFSLLNCYIILFVSWETIYLDKVTKIHLNSLFWWYYDGSIFTDLGNSCHTVSHCNYGTENLTLRKLLLPLSGFAVSNVVDDKKQFIVPKALSLCRWRDVTSVAHLLSCSTVRTNTDASAKHSARCQILIPAGTFLSCLNVFVVFLISIIQMFGYCHKLDHVQILPQPC